MLFAAVVSRVAFAVPAPTRGFEVDRSKRNEVVSFYHAIYAASEGYRDRIAWTGGYNSVAAGAEGTVSEAFVGDVERRINFHRALAGVKADVRVNSGATVHIQAGDSHVPPAATTKAAASQRSALMLVRSYPGSGGLSHDPSPTTTGWTSAAWNANRNSNLALGFFGPGAVDAYFREDAPGISAWNQDVGHRRWLLKQASTDFATGDTPGAFLAASNTVRPPSNSMYVIPKPSELDPTMVPVFAAYPPAGYFPAGLNSPYWSLSHPGADFSAATVTLRDAALTQLPVTVVSRREGYGDPAIVWQVPPAAAARAVAEDMVWNVTVSNIGGEGLPGEYSYQVRLIDPERIDGTPVVSGPESPPVAGAVYQISGAGEVDGLEAGVFLRRSEAWTEGAEAGAVSRVIDGTAAGYELRAGLAGYARSGTKSFRLTFPTRYDPLLNGVPEQYFELDRELVPVAGARLNFHYRRGLMTSASKLVVETSADGGRVWTALAPPYSGLGGGGEPAFQPASLQLPAGGDPLRVRFRYYLADPTSALYAHEDYPALATGVFVDDISVSGGDWLDRAASVAASESGDFVFDPAVAGPPLAGGQEWWLRARAILGGKPFPYGPPKVVTPVVPLQLNGPARPPTSGADYGFVAAPGATSYQLEVVAFGSGAPWVEGAEASPAPQVGDGTASAYALVSSVQGYRRSGAAAFRLGLSSVADEEDHFTIEREVVPSAASGLEFWVRRGPTSPTNRLHAELSADGGATWTSIWNLAGSRKADKTGGLRSIGLAAWAGSPVKIRFALRKDPGGVNLKWNARKSGMWLDDIRVTEPLEIVSSALTEIDGAADSFRLDETRAGGPLQDGSLLRLRLRARVGSKAGPWGEALIVTPRAVAMPLVAPEDFSAWCGRYPGSALDFEGDADRDGLADGIEYAFSLDPTDGRPVADRLERAGGRLALSRALPTLRLDLSYGAEWSEDLIGWSREGVEVRIEAGRIHATAPAGGGRRFLRWNVVRR